MVIQYHGVGCAYKYFEFSWFHLCNDCSSHVLLKIAFIGGLECAKINEMKKLIVCLLAVIGAHTSSVAQNNVVCSKTQVAFEVTPKVAGYSEMYIIFNREWVLDWFANDLEKCMKKVDKWTKVAAKESVTDVQRKVKGMEKLTFDFVTFKYNGSGYSIKGRETQAKVLGLPSILTEPLGNFHDPYFVPYFVVDNSGNCYLVLDCEIEETKFYTQNGSDGVSVSGAVAADNNGNAAVGAGASAGSARGTEYLNPVGVTLTLPVGEVQSFIDKLREGQKGMIETKEKNKAAKKLFK